MSKLNYFQLFQFLLLSTRVSQKTPVWIFITQVPKVVWQMVPKEPILYIFKMLTRADFRQKEIIFKTIMSLCTGPWNLAQRSILHRRSPLIRDFSKLLRIGERNLTRRFMIQRRRHFWKFYLKKRENVRPKRHTCTAGAINLKFGTEIHAPA